MKKILIATLLLASCGMKDTPSIDLDPASIDRLVDAYSNSNKLDSIIKDSIQSYVKTKVVNNFIDSNKRKKVTTDITNIVNAIDSGAVICEKVETSVKHLIK